MKIVIDRLPIMTNQVTVFITGVFSAFISWFSYQSSNVKLALVDIASAENFIELTQPIISYLGTIFGCLASLIALIAGIWNLKKKFTSKMNKKRRATD